jgi:hypothetical protein
VAAGGVEERKALLIIVTFNSYELIGDLAATIRQFLSDNQGNHAVVVENSADQRVLDYLNAELELERITVRVAQSNEGFSHGVNLGYRIARELWGGFDFIVLLNPDVISAGCTVAELVNRAALNTEAGSGIWSVVLRNERGEIDGGCARRVWNLRRLFSHLLGFPPFARMMLTPPRNLTLDEIDNDQSDLAIVSGALMCVRADVFEVGLDTHLPMYLEDQELCDRCIRKGFAIRVFPDLELIHVGGLSRKSNSNNQHALKIMDNVEAPAQYMSRLQEYRLGHIRPTVFFGGMSRLVLAPIVGGARSIRGRSSAREEVPWISDQVKLGYWCMLWAVSGRFHDEQVSLDDYFTEYMP